MGRAREFVRRNLVIIVMFPGLWGLHYGWQRIQDNETFVSKKERRDLPIIQGANYLVGSMKEKLGLKKE